MEYNSGRDILVISEYGRHVQNLINHALTIEEKEERQTFVEAIIRLMFQVNPGTHKNIEEVTEKLWKHAFRISDYKLNVDAPEGILITKEAVEAKPKPVPYPGQVKKFRHYGGYLQTLMDKAIALEDKEKQKEFLDILGSYMKMAYRTWNKDHYANDELIKADLKKLSKDNVNLDEVRLDLLNMKSDQNTSRYTSKGKGKKSKKKSHNMKRRRK